MKRVVSMTMAAVLLLTAVGCATSTSAGRPSESASVKVYTCPMHPEVTSDKPGNCPKCGMALIEKK